MEDRKQRRKVKSAAKSPKTIHDLMRVSLFIHKDGLLWVLHEKRLPDRLEWLEYDVDEEKMYLMGELGTVMELGVAVPEKCKELLLKTDHVMAAHIENEQLFDMTIVPVTIRDLALNKDEEDIETEED